MEKEKTYPRLVIKKSMWKYGSHPWRVFNATTNRWTVLLGRFASYTEALEFANAEIRYYNDDSPEARLSTLDTRNGVRRVRTVRRTATRAGSFHIQAV